MACRNGPGHLNPKKTSQHVATKPSCYRKHATTTATYHPKLKPRYQLQPVYSQIKIHLTAERGFQAHVLCHDRRTVGPAARGPHTSPACRLTFTAALQTRRSLVFFRPSPPVHNPLHKSAPSRLKDLLAHTQDRCLGCCCHGFQLLLKEVVGHTPRTPSLQNQNVCTTTNTATASKTKIVVPQKNYSSQTFIPMRSFSVGAGCLTVYALLLCSAISAHLLFLHCCRSTVSI